MIFIENKIIDEAQKVDIRNIFPPIIAERMCNIIDGKVKTEHLRLFLM